MTTLVIDLGGTNMRAASIDDHGALLARAAHPTPRGDRAPEALIALMRELATGADRAVVGVPGRVDHGAGRLEHAPNLPPSWLPSLSEAHLADALGLPVHLANDADLAAVGEAYFGAGRGFSDVAYLTMSTGVGAGVLLGKRLVRGRRSLAEVGHTVIDVGAAARGLPATFEALASGTGLARTAAWLGVEGAAAAVVARAAAGDPAATAALAAAITAAQVGVCNLAFTFSPEIVVIGGGFGRIGEALWGPIRRHLALHGPPGLDVPIRVAGAELGDDAALVGAAAWMQASGASAG